MANVAGWDIEIAQPFPDDTGSWRQAHLGITCSALVSRGYVAIHRAQTHQMEPGDAYAIMAAMMEYQQRSGGHIVTWNGAGFDFYVLARESFWLYNQAIKDLAIGHIDMGYQMLCERGFMIGLDTAAKGLGLQGKTKGMTGALAPLLWNDAWAVDVWKSKDPQHQEWAAAIKALGIPAGTPRARDLCVEYVTQDAHTTVEVYERVLDTRLLSWITQKGQRCWYPWEPKVTLDRGAPRLLTVAEASELPVPDTSWMSAPRSRQDLAGWIKEA